jgi:hypothetical protein
LFLKFRTSLRKIPSHSNVVLSAMSENVTDVIFNGILAFSLNFALDLQVKRI